MRIKNLLPVFCIIIICMLASCMGGQPLVRTRSDNNTTYKVDYLFEHDGCKVYRFYDMGQPVYFTNCSGSVSVAPNDSSHVRPQTIITRTEQR